LSGFIESNQIDQVQNSVNIVDIVSRYVALVPKGKEMVGLCLFHNDAAPSMMVNAEKQIFKCFACGAGGNVFSFLQRREQMSFPEAVKYLAKESGIELHLQERADETQGDSAQSSRSEIEGVNKRIAKWFQTIYEDETKGATAREYVTQRGVTAETAKQFLLGVSLDAWDEAAKVLQQSGLTQVAIDAGLLIAREGNGCYDRFRNRLMFPVIDNLGRVVAFGGRTLGDDNAKYMNSPESVLFNKSQSVYGLYAAKDGIAKQKCAIVVEGYLDCIMAHQHGVTNVVATLGTALTDGHAKILSRFAQEIVLVFDSDQAGQKAMERGIEIFFKQQIEVKIVTLPEGSDPCDYLVAHGGEAFQTLVDDGEAALAFKWRHMQEKFTSSDSVATRKAATDAFLLLVAKACSGGKLDNISKGIILHKVAKLIGISYVEVRQYLDQMTRQLSTRSAYVAPVDNLQDDIMESGPLTPFDKAYEQVVEVLINQPKKHLLLPAEIDFKDISDRRLSLVADRLWQYCKADKTGAVSEIIIGWSEHALCDYAIELAHRGEKRGNYESTLIGAIEYIGQCKKKSLKNQLCNQVIAAKQQYGKDAETALMYEYLANRSDDPMRIGTEK
jgi:DNA primase